MQRRQSANLLQAALIALALVSTLQLSVASLVLAPDRVTVAFNQTIVIDVLANDASDPTSLRISAGILLDGAFGSIQARVVQCGEPQHDCIQYVAPAIRTVSGVLETYRQVGFRGL
jgi:hypothetical protein